MCPGYNEEGVSRKKRKADIFFLQCYVPVAQLHESRLYPFTTVALKIQLELILVGPCLKQREGIYPVKKLKRIKLRLKK